MGAVLTLSLSLSLDRTHQPFILTKTPCHRLTLILNRYFDNYS